MKKETSPKKLNLAKVKIADLNVTQPKMFICATSFAETTCRGCRETLICL
ncbi:hypothetical protein [Chitinophaga qingshengii]|uniref:Class I lanthipeptide n=1 Tax=Chitinophaga qingshengii TaxID=1569794 RepID=A0ABR7TN99_9BACT|nr:hypothetical protein [Chitinophaga qingshengii]MBC9930899.1 hypothetical protein [Chitinophaga qingshengii]